MENTVTMSLEEYTKLVVENTMLKNKIEGLKLQAEKNVVERIREHLIDNLNKEETLKFLDASDKVLLNKFSEDYSWTWDSIARQSLVMSPEEVRNCAVFQIKKMLNAHLGYLTEKEDAQ